jgi:hypothetical protein
MNDDQLLRFEQFRQTFAEHNVTKMWRRRAAFSCQVLRNSVGRDALTRANPYRETLRAAIFGHPHSEALAI